MTISGISVGFQAWFGGNDQQAAPKAEPKKKEFVPRYPNVTQVQPADYSYGTSPKDGQGFFPRKYPNVTVVKN